MDFKTFDDIVGTLVQATQFEDQSKFLQGDVLLAAVDPDVLARFRMDQESMLKQLGVAVGRGRRTMYKRLQVARTFAPDERNPRVSWECHAVCANTPDPLGWLQHAADQELSVDQLRAAIKAAGDKQPNEIDLIYLWRAADAEIVSFVDGCLTLRMATWPLAAVREGAGVAVQVVEAVQTTAQGVAA